MEERILTMLPLLNEKQKRIFLATEAMSYGRGGITKVSQISGVSIPTIRRGIKEIKTGSIGEPGDKLRISGGGRKKTECKYQNIEECILKIIDQKTYGNPEKVLSYTTLSLRDIQNMLLSEYSIDASYRTIGTMLDKMGYSKQQNQKMLQVGKQHPDRNEQFEFINSKATEFLSLGLPVISVDTKKKENIGNFKNNGREYRPKGEPRKVLDHDFPISELGKVAPYGVYVLNDNTGFINLGTDHGTAEFAVESILRWWNYIGENIFPNADKIYINCDNGGSNGSRVRLWKYSLQKLANITGLEIHVSHFPPGTSKWNKVEHKLFCYISKNWEGQPLIDIETIVKLISSTTTSKGLTVQCIVDENKYNLHIKISDEEYKKIALVKDERLGDWNYIIHPLAYKK